MNFCPRCGTQLIEDAVFCNSCGLKLEEQSVERVEDILDEEHVAAVVDLAEEAPVEDIPEEKSLEEAEQITQQQPIPKKVVKKRNARKSKTALIIIIILALVIVVLGSLFLFYMSNIKNDTEIEPNRDLTRSKFVAALRELRETGTAPDGKELEIPEEGIESESFAIDDINGDGIEDLVINWNVGTHVNQSCRGYSYNPKTDSFEESFVVGPNCDFVSNGRIVSEKYNGQGAPGSMVPMQIDMYNPATSSYEHMYDIESWEKDYEYDNYLSDTPFPDDIDIDDDGVVYIIIDAKTGKREILDNQKFEDWWMEEIEGDGYYVDLDFVNITENNIRKYDPDINQLTDQQVLDLFGAKLSEILQDEDADVDFENYKLAVLDVDFDDVPDLIMFESIMSGTAKILISNKEKGVLVEDLILNGEVSMHAGVNGIYMTDDGSTVMIESFWWGGGESDGEYYTEIYDYDGERYVTREPILEYEPGLHLDVLGDYYTGIEKDEDGFYGAITKQDVVDYFNDLYGIEVTY